MSDKNIMSVPIRCDWENIDTSLLHKLSDEHLLEQAKHCKIFTGWGVLAEVCKRLSRKTKEKPFIEYLRDQIDFSWKTFGPGTQTKGVLDHIRKELDEVEAAPSDLEEWIDLVMLSLDGAWRAGFTPDVIYAALQAKLEKNKKRDWPDWRTADTDKALEHKRP